MSKSTSPDCKAYLVESIPIGLEDLTHGTEVHYTAKVLETLTNRAQDTIDITAMYWNLTPNPNRQDEAGFSIEDLCNKFGASEGQAVYDALEAAAGRGVKIRIIESPGFGTVEEQKKDNESGDLQKEHPKQVEIRQVQMKDWYGGSGIMHQKIWVFDNRNLYIGSANNDWKSLTQVKEIGVAVEENREVAAAVTRYFDTWWKFCGLTEPTVCDDVFDPEVQITRTVPSWSELVPVSDRDSNPLNKKRFRAKHDWETPISFQANGSEGGLVLSGSPAELCVGGRTHDVDALVRTIMDAEQSVCVNVMDLAPVSLYRGTWSNRRGKYMLNGNPATPVWWSQLFDALVHVTTTKALNVRLLVSDWAHTSEFIAPYLEALRRTATAGAACRTMDTGSLEVRRFRIPGWDSTENKKGETTGRQYPGHTRVNHTKYIVTDRRANIGTSNMTWDYFAATAGASFNTDHKDLVRDLQEVFDRDWNSEYAEPSPANSSH